MKDTIILLLLPVIVCGFYAPVFSGDVDNYLQKAEVLFREAEYDEAINLYSKIIMLDPNNYMGYFGLGIAYSNKGDFIKDIAYYQNRVDRFKGRPEFLYELATAYETKREFNNAADCLVEVIKIDPYYYPAYRSLADVYGVTGEYEKELECLKKAKKISPFDKDIFFSSRIPYGRKIYYEKAVKFLKKSLKLNPDYYESYYALAMVYFKRLDYDVALKYLLKFLSRKPEDAEANYFIGLLYFQKNNAFEALGHLKKAVEAGCDNLSDACLKIGNLYFWQLNDFRQAEDYFERARRINPGNADIYYQLGIMYLSKKNIEGAVRQLRQLEMLNRKDLFQDLDYLIKNVSYE